MQQMVAELARPSLHVSACQTGHLVRMKGLQSHSDLNGETGTLLQFSEQRWGVQPVGDANAVRVKPTNLDPVICVFCGSAIAHSQLAVGSLCNECLSPSGLDWYLETTPDLPYRDVVVPRTALPDPSDASCCPRCQMGSRVGHMLLTSAHTKQPVPCKAFGFERIYKTFTSTLSREEARMRYASYTKVYVYGVGRWDRESSPVDGLITFNLNSCIAVYISDSATSPSRCSLLHSPISFDWSNRVAQEVAWVAAASGSTVSVTILKGKCWRRSNETLVGRELSWELADAMMPEIRAVLEPHICLRLVHQPVWCGVVAAGRYGLAVPILPHYAPFGLFGQEMAPELMLRRHHAFFDLEYDGALLNDLDLQYNGSKYIEVSYELLQRRLKSLRGTPLELLWYKPPGPYGRSALHVALGTMGTNLQVLNLDRDDTELRTVPN